MAENTFVKLVQGHTGLGDLQSSGALDMLPLIGPDVGGRFARPFSELKLTNVRGYGKVELKNSGGRRGGLGIVPLHAGYIQDGAQNHALCRTGFLAPGQRLVFSDACCVQENQGGFLQDTTPFILPLALREPALELRGREDYSKLWHAIASLNQQFGLPVRGHLEQIVCRLRPVLTQFAARFEVLPNQRGAFFFIGNRLVGVELAPTAAYFHEVFKPLVCFCYGPAAFHVDDRRGWHGRASAEPLHAGSLQDLETALAARRRKARLRLEQAVADARLDAARDWSIEETFADYRLATIATRALVGQVVERGRELVYVSLFARRKLVFGLS